MIDITSLVLPPATSGGVDDKRYLVYCSGKTPKILNTKYKSSAKKKIQTGKEICHGLNFVRYYRSQDHSTEMTAQHYTYLFFEAKDFKWVFVPEESFAVALIKGYPYSAYMDMYHAPIRIKDDRAPTDDMELYERRVLINKYNKEQKEIKIPVNGYEWMPLSKVVEASKSGNVR